MFYILHWLPIAMRLIKKINTRLIFGVIVMLLFGCGEKNNGTSSFPMPLTGLGEGPWQIETWNGDKVVHETIALDGDGVVVRSQSVYIDKSSRFVYRDGAPIKTYNGNHLYWNKDGFVINKALTIIFEDEIFIVNGKPMKPRTAMRLKGFNSKSNNYIARQ